MTAADARRTATSISATYATKPQPNEREVLRIGVVVGPQWPRNRFTTLLQSEWKRGAHPERYQRAQLEGKENTYRD